jgi:hypothetical protein
MKRFFISKHPTFGSYKNPVAHKIEQSPYYFWWLALTLNEEYLELCASTSQDIENNGSPIHKVFADFGDVRYDGDKYKAFANWWRRKANDTETMGEYLFSEPVAATKVMLVDDAEAAVKSASDASSLLINIPKNLTRKQIDKALDKLFRKELSFEKGRQTRNPTRSNDRYSLSKPAKAESLKSAFDIIEAQREALAIGKKLSNVQLADKVGLKVEISEATRTQQDGLAEYEIYLLSTTVSRKKKLAKTAIASAAKGIFP